MGLVGGTLTHFKPIFSFLYPLKTTNERFCVFRGYTRSSLSKEWSLKVGNKYVTSQFSTANDPDITISDLDFSSNCCIYSFKIILIVLQKIWDYFRFKNKMHITGLSPVSSSKYYKRNVSHWQSLRKRHTINICYSKSVLGYWRP